MQSENCINANAIECGMLNDNKGNAIKKEYVNKDSAKEKITRLYTANKKSALALALSNTLKINTKKLCTNN